MKRDILHWLWLSIDGCYFLSDCWIIASVFTSLTNFCKLCGKICSPLLLEFAWNWQTLWQKCSCSVAQICMRLSNVTICKLWGKIVSQQLQESLIRAQVAGKFNTSTRVEWVFSPCGVGGYFEVLPGTSRYFKVLLGTRRYRATRRLSHRSCRKVGDEDRKPMRLLLDVMSRLLATHHRENDPTIDGAVDHLKCDFLSYGHGQVMSFLLLVMSCSGHGSGPI